MSKSKKRLRTERSTVRTPKDKPQCQLHGLVMEYNPLVNLWECVVDGCDQKAWPRQDISRGKPVLGSGTLELALVDDPEGNRNGRVLIRSEDNIIIDLTDNIIDEPQVEQGYVDVQIRLYHVQDNRTR